MPNSGGSIHQRTWWIERRLSLRRFGLLLAALISICAYPALFIYFFNIKEAIFAQVAKPLVIFISVALSAWLVFGILSGKMAKGALTAILFMLVFMNYSLIDNIFRRIVPDWRWWRIAPCFLFLFINWALALRLFIKSSKADSYFMKIIVSIGSVFLALTLFNTAGGMYTLASTSWLKSRPVDIGSPPAEHKSTISPADTQPNFYFLIFDEYARQDMLKKYAGYDNTPFLKGLERKGFSVSYSSYSTSDSTRTSIGNLLHYAVKYQTDAETMEGIARPPLFEVFRKARYKIYSLSSIYQIDEDLVDVMLKPTTVLETLSIEKTVINGSFIACFQPNGNESYRADRLGLLKQLAKIAEESSTIPKFIFFHILLPHEPFIFDENADPLAYENMHNWANPKYYTGQLRFLSKELDKLTNIIIEKDPDAIVLMQSDHGARYFKVKDNRERLACFNCLYLRGKHVQIEGLSTIDTLRTALTYALGFR